MSPPAGTLPPGATLAGAFRSRGALALWSSCLSSVVATLLVGAAAWTISWTADRARTMTRQLVDVSLDGADLRIDLEHLLLIERSRRVSSDPAERANGLASFDVVASHALATAARLDPRPFHDHPTLARGILQIRALLGPAVSDLRREIRSSSWRGPGTRPDADAALAVALAAASGLEARGRVERVHARETVTHLTRDFLVLLFVAIFASLATLTVLAVCLIQDRARLLQARRHEAIETARLAGVVASMRDGVAVFDDDGHLAFRNDRLVTEANLDPRDCAPGTSYEHFVAALAIAGPDVLSDAVPAEDAPVSASVRTRSRVLEIYRCAMPLGGQLVAIADVTDRVENETLARQAQKIDVLGRLTGGIAHDFNNLLQSLSANLEIAREPRQAGTARAAACLQASADGVERGIRLTRHLLGFARRQELRHAPVDLPALLHEMTDLLQRTLGDRIAVDCEVPPDLWPILTDRSQLENALLNIALNARDAMEHGGSLSITAGNSVEQGRAFVRISLRDTGIGMTDDEIERSVEPFYTTKSEAQGTGLGLSLVDGFARQSGGRLELSSRKGEGTAVAILLPRADRMPVAASPIVPDPVRPGSGELVLLVEDDPAVLEAARSALEFLGYEIRTAVDADSAWAALSGGLRPAMVFSDLMMPGEMDAAELVRRARALQPGLPVLLNTGNLDAPVLRDIVLDERTILVPKPWRLASLSRRIRDLLEPAAVAPGHEVVPV